MRPSIDKSGTSVYECVACGRREREPEERVCPDCGVTMRNVGRSQDV